MLKINNLQVEVINSNKQIINDFSLTIKEGEIHAIMGPNGTGKSTLSKVIMKDKNYKITNGSIIYNDTNLENLTTDEIARKGIYLLMQDVPVIDGVTNSECLRTALKQRDNFDNNIYTFIKNMKEEQENLNIKEELIHQFINKGLSGGEKKKNEVLQLKILKPSFIILDELDSGLDVDSLKIVANNINNYLKENKETSILIITHYSRILDLIKPDYVHQMNDGKIVKTGNINLAKEIEKNGYNGLNEIRKSEVNE